MAALVEAAVTAAIAAVRSDSAPSDWVLIGYSGPEVLAVLGTGEGGIDALKGCLPESDICYGLIRKEHTWETAGAVNAKTIKHVWIYWFPDSTPLARKRKVGVFEGQIKRMFAPYHAEMHPSSLSEVSETHLAALLDSITMRTDHTGDKKATGAALGARTSVATVDRQQQRGFLPTGTGADTAKAAAGAVVSFEDPAAFKAAIKAVSSNDVKDDWCLVGYKDQRTLQVIGHGTGGLDALLAQAQDNIINYGMLRVSDKHDMTDNVLFCFIAWQPEDVPPMVKARASTHRGAVASAFREHQPFHFEFRATTRSDLTQDMVLQRIGECTGSKSMVGDASTAAARTRPNTPPASGIRSPQAASPTAIAAAAAGLSTLDFEDKGQQQQAQQQQVQFEDEAALREAIARVRKDEDPADYCVATFSTATRLRLEDVGSGGWAAVAEKLQSDNFAYALVRVKETIDASETIKFCFVKWTPDSVLPTLRGKLGVLSGAVAKVFQPYHGDIVISERSDLTEAAVMGSVSNLRARNKA